MLVEKVYKYQKLYEEERKKNVGIENKNERNFTIVYKLKENLEESKKEFIGKKIETCISKFNLEKHKDGALYKKTGFKGNEDFGGVTFTYALLKENVDCFEKLEWHDMYADLVKRAC